MSYATLMVYVEAYARPEQRIRLAAQLAARFKAQLIALSASHLVGADSPELEWRSALDFPIKVLAQEARAADLVIVGQKPEWRSSYQSVDAGGVILRMGRPTLI